MPVNVSARARVSAAHSRDCSSELRSPDFYELVPLARVLGQMLAEHLLRRCLIFCLDVEEVEHGRLRRQAVSGTARPRAQLTGEGAPGCAQTIMPAPLTPALLSIPVSTKVSHALRTQPPVAHEGAQRPVASERQGR